MLTRDYNIYECNRCKSFRVTVYPVEKFCKHFKVKLIGESKLTHPPDGCPAWEKGRPEYIKLGFMRIG